MSNTKAPPSPALRNPAQQPAVAAGEPTLLETTSRVARKYVGFVGVISLFINLAMLTVPIYMLQIYDRVLTSRNEATLYLLTAVAIVLLGALGSLELVRSRVMVRLGRWYDEQLRVWLAHLSITRGRDSQATRDLDDFRSFLGGPGLVALFDAPWTPIFIVAVFLLHPLLGVIAVAGALVLGALALLNELSTRTVLSEASFHATKANRFADLVSRNAEVIQAMAMSAGACLDLGSGAEGGHYATDHRQRSCRQHQCAGEVSSAIAAGGDSGRWRMARDTTDHFSWRDDRSLYPCRSRACTRRNRDWFLAHGGTGA